MANRRIFDIIFNTKGTDKAQKNIGDVDDKIVDLGATAKQTATILSTAMAAATVAVGIKAIKTAGQFEMLRARLRGLTGSQKEANRLFEEFNKIASETPFAVEEVIDAGATLQAFGLDAENLLTGIADLAAFMQVDMSTAAQNFGRAMNAGAGAADMFRDKGVNQLVASFAGVKNVTELTLPQFQEALQKFIIDPSQPVAGATKLMAETLEGKFSNAGDAVNNLAAEFGEKLLPVVKKATDMFIVLVTSLDVDRLTSYSIAITSLSGAFGAYRVSVLLAANATKVFKNALVTSGVGLAIVGLGELVNALTKHKEKQEESNTETKKEGDLRSIVNRHLANKNELTKVENEQSLAANDLSLVGNELTIRKTELETNYAEVSKTGYAAFVEEKMKLIAAEKTQQAHIDQFILSYPKLAKEMGLVTKKEQEHKAALVASSNAFGAMGSIATSTSQLLGVLAGGDKHRQIQALEMARFAAIANIAQGVTKAIAQGGIFGIATGASVAAAGAVQIATITQQISDIRAAQFGMNEMVSKPTLILAGEAGPERVNITPASRPSSEQGSGGMTINFLGPVTNRDFVRDTIIPEIDRVQRLGLA
tara:strand:+ start:1905 stop:3686 length:1782 start_codon:yes stop_codon:yes gene_type:complete